MSQPADVVALIATHNRRAELARCVEAIREQSRPPREIVVVDNGSRDSTTAWLEKQPDLISFRQSNLGTAGGVARGLAEARRMGFGSIWTIDDDCLPSRDCLQRLLESRAFNEQRSIVGSLVLSTTDSERLAFPMPLPSSYVSFLDWYSRVTVRVADITREADPLGYFWPCLFNSVLFPQEMIDEVGLPRTELFMWGDEVEYTLRIQAADFSTYMVLDSIARHPPWTREAMAPWKEAYSLRNKVWINRRYGRWARAKALVRAAQVVRRQRFDLLRPLWDGVVGDLSRSYHDDPRWTEPT
jgi:rhamnopyranosyl-N-acetylglucosaminyl-diphospho-decaprenol beta-1,3/1,4-galactofuranosyltransferase